MNDRLWPILAIRSGQQAPHGNLGALYHAVFVSGGPIPPKNLASLALSLVAVAGWVWIVTQTWVRDGADGYARALFAVCDVE